MENMSFKDIENDPAQVMQVETYYKIIQQQMLNIVVNNFEVPLIIVVNVKDNRFDEAIELNDHAKSKQLVDRKVFTQEDVIVTENWFENNINDKLEQRKTNFKIFCTNLNQQNSLKSKLKQYRPKDIIQTI